jgi:hypothetical protein
MGREWMPSSRWVATEKARVHDVAFEWLHDEVHGSDIGLRFELDVQRNCAAPRPSSPPFSDERVKRAVDGVVGLGAVEAFA